MMDPKIPRVKVCCIKNIQEAELAINYGASALGLVSEMPSGPGVISEEDIIKIIPKIPPAIASFLLTSKQDTKTIIEQQKRTGANTLQLCDRLIHGSYEELKDTLRGIKIVQVIHVTGEESIKEAQEISRHVDAILLDSGNQKLSTKILGGTGKTHDWNISKIIRESINIPLFLAGGLNPDNIKEAIIHVKPFGVDLCNGIRTDGKLDEKKLKNFMENVYNA
jgi:phosphoribosylanthranilate isomerase